MGREGEELLCEREREWGGRGSRSRMKTGRKREGEWEKGAQEGDLSLTILSKHDFDETLHELQF